jgi:hypothetical protein
VPLDVPWIVEEHMRAVEDEIQRALPVAVTNVDGTMTTRSYDLDQHK